MPQPNENALVIGSKACVVCDGYGWHWMPSRYPWQSVGVWCCECNGNGRKPKEGKAAA